MIRARFLAWVGVMGALVMLSCGGGGGSLNSGTTTVTPAAPPSLTIPLTQSLPSTVAGKAYSAQLQATGGTPPYTWSTGAGFPSWLGLDTKTGIVSGTVPVPSPVWFSQQFQLPVKVSDSATPANSISASVFINADGQIAFVDPATLSGTLGLNSSWMMRVQGGHSPYAITVDSGLPGDLTAVQPHGTVELDIQGILTQSGTLTAQVRVKDSASTPQEVVLPLTFNIDKKFALFNASLHPAVIGRAYSDQLTAVNGIQPLAWSATLLPAGLNLDALSGKISGTATAPGGGWYVTVKDSSSPPQIISQLIGMIVAPEISFSSTLPNGNLKSMYGGATYQGGGVPPVAAVVTSGSLPPGLFANQGAFLTGIPTQTGTYGFEVTATDSDTPPVISKHQYTLNVYTALPVPGSLTLPTGAVNKPYSAQLYAYEGMLPYTWSLQSGQLPPGLTLAPSGAITGTPQSAASYTFTAAVTDSATPPQMGARYYAIPILNAFKGRNDSIATATPLPNGFANATFSPYADPADSTTSAPDSDFYSVSAAAGDKVRASVYSNNGVDPVVEILDANGQRYKTCRDVGDDAPSLTFIVKDPTPDAFDDDCLNDDIDPTVNRNAMLEFMVPGAAGTNVTYFVHVFDASGNARPDMSYTLSVFKISP
jgi:hypothetical protein